MAKTGIFTYVLMFFLLCAPSAYGAVPEQIVKESAEKIMAMLNDNTLRGNTQELKNKIKTVIEGSFDFDEMSKRALGVYWSKTSEADRKEYVRLFMELVENVYIGKIIKYTEEKVVFLEERVEDRYATVATEITTPKGVKIPITYRLTKDTGQWKVYDVSIEGVSLVNNYRSQFNQILGSKPFPELLNMLREKNKTFDGKAKS